ncbi:MAG: ADP-ribosylation factor-like protein [Anaerolineales bacterium]|nr:ADP-ribosylation factor-like protein [Anaerolineales bacterium]
MFINWKQREIKLKIVYYGASLCGKTTNLEFLHASIPAGARSDLVSLKTREDRTIFFDFLEIQLGEIKGLKPKFSLYTVPGQLYYIASRKLVLQGADGVVFVVDSAPDRREANLEAWNNLSTNLREFGFDLNTFPIIIQFNKRDLPNAAPLEELRSMIRCNGHPQIEAVASQGIGVFESLRPTIKSVMVEAQRHL